MKKVIVSMIALISMAPAFGMINEWDPTFTPEQRKRAHENNQAINRRNEEIQKKRNQEIEQATKKYLDQIEAIKEKYRPVVG